MGSLLAQAVAANLPVESLERLVALKERCDRVESERQFNRAMTEFQSKCPAIAKNKSASFGQGKAKYDFVTFDAITITIAPLLSECGLSFRFDSKLDANAMTVTCTVYHVSGFSRDSTFTSPIDSSSSMNIQQKGASALTYAKRYALLLALGIGSADMDYDGMIPNEPQAAAISDQDLTRLLKRLVKHIQVSAERHDYVSELGVKGDPTKADSWSREAYESANKFCDEMEGGA